MCVFLAALFSTKAAAQTTTVYQTNDTRVITTGAPFMLIATDARAAGMGDMGLQPPLTPILNNGIPLNMPFLKQNLDLDLATRLT